MMHERGRGILANGSFDCAMHTVTLADTYKQLGRVGVKVPGREVQP